GAIKATIADSVASRNGTIGFFVISTAGQAVTTLVAVGSQAVNNVTTGLQVVGTIATMFVGQTTVSGNANGWIAASGGLLNSYGNNYVNGNAGNEGAMPLVATK